MHSPAPKIQWREVGAHGKPKPSLYNVRAGLMAMKIICRHDLFRDVTIIGVAGDQTTHEVKPIIGELTNAALLMLRQMFSVFYGFDPDDKYILDAVKTLAFENCFDPILDMLTEAQAGWDKTKRLDTWVVKYLKCKDTKLNRAIGRKVLVAAVRRAREPGCKFDNITVLEGDEGWDKSTAIRTLAGDEYFSDQSILGARDKEIQEQLSGIWMHESADLTGLKKAEVEHVKAFASRQVDRARPAYGRVVEKKPRRSIDWATTNDEEYLQSQTGNRRFWPLPVGRIDIEGLSHDRLQLLGEAAHYESERESIVLDEKFWPDAKIEQEKRRAKDPWEDILANIPDRINRFTDFDLPGVNNDVQIIHRSPDSDGFELQQVASADLLTYVLRVPIGQQERRHSMKLSTIMKLLGWQRPDSQKVTINGQQVRGYNRRVEKP
jgi:predicted P-loop ATPase